MCHWTTHEIFIPFSQMSISIFISLFPCVRGLQEESWLLMRQNLCQSHQSKEKTRKIRQYYIFVYLALMKSIHSKDTSLLVMYYKYQDLVWWKFNSNHYPVFLLRMECVWPCSAWGRWTGSGASRGRGGARWRRRATPARSSPARASSSGAAGSAAERWWTSTWHSSS